MSSGRKSRIPLAGPVCIPSVYFGSYFGALRAPCQLRNAATPQRPMNAQLPTPKTPKQERGTCVFCWEFAFLPWMFWALGVGRSLGVGSCGVAELTLMQHDP